MAQDGNVKVTFVSQKIKKIRWIPEDYAEAQCFFTGSWDDEINDIKVWVLDYINDNEVKYPKEASKFVVEGDVTEIQFTGKNVIAVSTSDGKVRLLQISEYERKTPLKEVFIWNNLHKIARQACSCTTLATMEGDIASVGEDGNINILNSRRGDITRTITEADSCSLHSVCFIKHNEIITGNFRGHMKIWDLRSPDNKPTNSFLFGGDQLATTCIINHPTQPYYILAGSESGAIAIWDLRMNTFPSALKGHSYGVTEMRFHPENPNKLLTSSLSGELWEWNMEAVMKNTKATENWIPLQDKNATPTNTLLESFKPLNSFDCNKGNILVAGENEAIHYIKNFKY
ncbi:PREDICTED: nucleoporin Nup43 [Papilio polytes]|uniref:nucleoporin Nup43 n=1 Tax=Papilio polytes TaxID=76194 RepID=UPI0006760E6D|nr:PREDICTED: nucleoporin Nup43 [Papilio polytes]